MPKHLLNDPAHWRRLAEETRRVAEQLDDPLAKRTLLEVAEHYEQIAVIAEAGAVTDRP
jgi:hypothetical protein